jgi:uncharacterized protein (DUF486 family)
MVGLRYAREIGWLYQTAMVLLLVTIGLGMSRGIGLVSFEDRNVVLTHLHSGTIGWITLGIAATVLWIYGGTAARAAEDSWVTRIVLLLIVTVPLYIAAWWTGIFPFRAVAGALVLIGVLAFVAWLVRQAARIGYRQLSVPQLGTVIGLATLVFGSALGVYLQVQFATGSIVPGSVNLIGAHAETQVSAYLVLVAMSIAYWRLVPERPGRERRGTWMVWLFFFGGAIIAVALLANVIQASAAYIPLDIAAFVLFLTLTWRRVLAPGWFVFGSARHYAIAIPFALLYLGIFIYLIVGFAVLQIWKDFSEVPPQLIPATEHPLFVGMVTNTLFGLLIDLNATRRRIWPWADHVLFWGMSLAVLAFTIAILVAAKQFYPIITPVLGGSILVGIIAHSLRLRAPSAEATR